jgi:hypothetical protein
VANLQKHAREVLRRIEAMGATATIATGKAHYKLTATVGDVSVQVPVSCSPSDERQCVNQVAQMVRRGMAARGVTL